MTEFSGAVIGPGQVMVDSNVKRVQHPTGGVVGELHVRDGRQARAGDILIRLDNIQTRANFAIVSKALDELTARQARLEAERDGEDTVVFPRDLLDRADNADVARAAVTGELRQFETRRGGREGLKGPTQGAHRPTPPGTWTAGTIPDQVLDQLRGRP